MRLLTIDWPELSLQVTITFAHFLWQACVVAILFSSWEQAASMLSGRAQALRSHVPNEPKPDGLCRSATIGYTFVCLAFFSLPICVAATFAWVHQSRGPILLAASETPESIRILVEVASDPTLLVDVPVLPRTEIPAETGLSVTEPDDAQSFVAPETLWTERLQSFAPYLLIAYAIGVASMLTRFGLSIFGSSRLRRTLQPITNSNLLSIIVEQSSRLGTRIGVTRRGFTAGLAMVSLLLVSLAAWGQIQTAEKKAETGIQWSTWGDKEGLLSGARLILPQGGLEPGQPLVVEYRLANVSKETKTLECFMTNGMKLDSLSRGNRIGGSGFDWHPEPVTLIIEPGDVFVDTEHLVSIDTTGLEPGDYEAALGSAFHYPDDANPKTAHEIPHRGSIPFTIVGESKVQPRELPKNDIHWGNPVAGLQLGAKFAGDPKAFTVGATVEADQFVANVTDQPIECSVAMPARRDGWLFNVEDRNGNAVTLERAIPILSYSPPQYILLKLAPGEIAPITAEGMFRVSMTPHSDVEPIQYTSPNVRFRIVGSNDEAKSPWQVEGFPVLNVFAFCTWQDELNATQPWQDDGANWVHGKLISQGAEFSTIFGVTLLRPEIPALRLHLDSGNVPFSVTNAVVQSSPALLKESFRLPEHSSVGEVGFVSDSQSIVSLAWETVADQLGLRVTVRNWSLATQERTGEVDLEWQPDWSHYVANLLLSQDGTRVVGLLDGQIAVWDAGSGKIIHRYDIPEDITNDKSYSVTLSHLTGTPDLSRIAFGRSVSLGGILPNADAIVMDTNTGRVIQKVKLEHRVHAQSLALSTDGRRLATVGSQYGASIWDVESGQLVLDFRNDNINRKHPDLTVKTSSTQLVSSVGFSPSAKSFAVSDILGIKLVDTQTGKVLRNIDAPYRYYDANSQFIFSADGQLFALLGTYPEDGEPRTISIWSAESGERLRTFAIQATAAAFSSDGKWFAAGKSDFNEALAVWQIREDKPAKPAVAPPDEANGKDSRIREFQLVDGENGTPLQGLECKANIFKQGTPPRLQPCRSNNEGIVEVQIFEGEGAWIAEVPRGWFTSAPSVAVIELDENGKPKHEQTAVNNQEPAVVKLWRGEEVTGRLLWPDKTAAVGVKLTAGVYINNQSWKEKLGMDLTWYSFDHGDWPNWNRTVVTDDAGRFHFTVPPEQARWWLRIGTTALGFGPQIGVSEDDSVTQRLAKCMPLEIQYGGNGRGNIPVIPLNSTASDEVLRPGDLQLQTGVIVRGRVVDAEGEGLSNVHLTTTGPHGPHSGRKAISGEDGKFEFPAMAAGNLTVHPDARFRDGKEKLTGTANTRDVQAVFVSQSFTIPETDKPHEIAIRAVPHTEVRFEWVDRREDKTQPISYYGTFRVRGYMPDDNGKPSTYWNSETERVERDGKSLLVVKIPTQLLKPELMLVADRKVTASYSDSTGVTSGPGIVPLGDITANTTRTIFGDEPRKPADSKKSQEHARNDQSSWIPARPFEVTVSKEGTAKILEDHSVRLEGEVQWQEASLQFEFDKPTNVEEIRLEILAVESPAGPQFGRGGSKLMLFDVKPSIENQAGKSSSLDFTSCTYLQSPSDETTANCIDHLTDTGWKVPSLPADATAHELVLRFEKPITLRAGQWLTLTVDSGGSDDLAVLNRIRFAFHQAAVSEPGDDTVHAEPREILDGEPKESALKPQAAVEPAGTATMKMRFVYDGDVPEPKLITPVRGIPGGGPIPDESLLVDPITKGIRNFVVFVDTQRSEVEMKKAPYDAKRHPLEMVNARFNPHVLIGQVGDTVDVINRDPLAYSPNFRFLINPAQDLKILPAKNHPILLSKREPAPVLIACNAHPWMQSYLFVLDHPYALVSDKDGLVTIDGLPAKGRLTFRVYHEGRQIKEVKIAGETKAWSSGRFDVDMVLGMNDLGEVLVPPKTFSDEGDAEQRLSTAPSVKPTMSSRDVVVLKPPSRTEPNRVPLPYKLPDDFVLLVGRLANLEGSVADRTAEFLVDRMIKPGMAEKAFVARDELPTFRCAGPVLESKTYPLGEPILWWMTQGEGKWEVVAMQNLTPEIRAIIDAVTGDNPADALRPLITPHDMNPQTTRLIELLASPQEIAPLMRQIIRETPALLEPLRGAEESQDEARWEERWKLVYYRLSPAIGFLEHFSPSTDSSVIDLTMPCFPLLRDNGGEELRDVLTWHLAMICKAGHENPEHHRLSDEHATALRTLFWEETKCSTRNSNAKQFAYLGLGLLSDAKTITTLIEAQSQRPIGSSHSRIVGALSNTISGLDAADAEAMRIKASWIDSLRGLSETSSSPDKESEHVKRFATVIAQTLHQQMLTDDDERTLRNLANETKVAWLKEMIAPVPPGLETGTVVLHAMDADSGEPIPNVTFVIENLKAEQWAAPVGKSGDDGRRQLEMGPKPGYFFSIHPVPDGYQVKGLDEVPAGVVVGGRIEHRFHLRKRGTNADFPEVLPTPETTKDQLPVPSTLTKSGSIRSSVDNMPGFVGQQIQFVYHPSRTEMAERVFRNGLRVRAALDNELEYFRKAEGEKAGDITVISDVLIAIQANKQWVLRCRTKDGMKLRDGFEVHFNDLDSWDLKVPAYVHPEF